MEEWRERFIAKFVKKFAKERKVPDLMVVHLKNGKDEIMPLGMPNQSMQMKVLASLRQQIAAHREQIDEVALIANVMELEHEPSKIKKTDIKQKAIMILFETRKGVAVRRFHVNRGKLTEAEEIKNGEVTASFSLGFYEKPPDVGQMYR